MNLQDVVVPMMTPLTAAGEIDEGGAARLTSFLIANGASGLFPLGSSGEFVSLPWRKQRVLLNTVAVTAAHRVPVCAGVSGNCLEEIHDRAREAAELGADYVVALTPFYFRLSQGEMVDFFTAIADLSPVPVIIYNMPFRTNNSVDAATVETLAANPRIAAIKDTVPDMARTLDVLGRVAHRDDFAYLHGNEMLSLPAMLYGAKGMVPSVANFAPRLLADACTAARNKEVDRMPEWQQRIKSLMRVFSLYEARAQESTTLRLQAIKSVLRLMGLCEDYMAQLDQRPDDAQLARVEAFMKEVGIEAPR